MKTRLVTILMVMTCLSGCAATTLKAPCPHYGAHCAKTPVNRWNSNQ